MWRLISKATAVGVVVNVSRIQRSRRYKMWEIRSSSNIYTHIHADGKAAGLAYQRGWPTWRIPIYTKRQRPTWWMCANIIIIIIWVSIGRWTQFHRLTHLIKRDFIVMIIKKYRAPKLFWNILLARTVQMSDTGSCLVFIEYRISLSHWLLKLFRIFIATQLLIIVIHN